MITSVMILICKLLDGKINMKKYLVSDVFNKNNKYKNV